MHINARRIPGLLFAALLLVACTRNRAAAEPTATLSLPTAPVVATKSGTDPGVTMMTDTVSAATPPSAAAAAETATPVGSQTPDAASTSTPATFDYIVKVGETLGAISAKYGVDVDTLRRLNYLVDDNIFSGQILHIPGRDGAGNPASTATTPAGSETNTADGTAAAYRYTVQAGDSLGAIAQRFGISTVKIIAANNLLDPDHLLVGAKLLIPDYQPDASTTPAAGTDDSGTAAGTEGQGVEHIVQPGEGLSQIAAKYGVDEATIAAANGITNRNLLRAGQKLTIPGISPKQAAKARGQIHIVQSGESLANIAAQLGVTVDELAKLNNITDPDTIQVGQELIIPEQ